MAKASYVSPTYDRAHGGIKNAEGSQELDATGARTSENRPGS